MTKPTTQPIPHAPPRYRVVEDAEEPGVFEVVDTATASGAWRRIETHLRRDAADAAASWWNARVRGSRA